jgi:hypothetical protein
MMPARTLGRREAAEALLVGAALPLYFLVRGLTEGRSDEAMGRSVRLIQLEERLHLFWEPRLQQLVLPHRPLMEFLNGVYLWGHLPVIAALAVLLYVWRRETYLLMRNAFLIPGGIGLIIFATLPVAPPRLTPESGLADTVLWASSSASVVQPAPFVNQYAAVPSLHFGWNLLVGAGIAVAIPHRVARSFAVAMPFAMLAAVILTGNHYILDALAGLAVVALGLLLALLLRRLGRPCQVTRPVRASGRAIRETLCWLAGLPSPGELAPDMPGIGKEARHAVA